MGWDWWWKEWSDLGVNTVEGRGDRGAWERGLHLHPHPKRQLFSAAVSRYRLEMQAQRCQIFCFLQNMEIQVFTWNILIFKYWQQVQLFALFFNIMRAKLNKSVG